MGYAVAIDAVPITPQQLHPLSCIVEISSKKILEETMMSGSLMQHTCLRKLTRDFFFFFWNCVTEDALINYLGSF